MDLIVCMKRVPDSAAKIRVAGDGKTIDPSGVDHVISPYDEMALEKALQIREQAGEGTVTVICLGPPEATKEIFRSTIELEDYAMGVDTQRAADSGLLQHLIFGRNEPALHHFRRCFAEALELPHAEEVGSSITSLRAEAFSRQSVG